MQDSQRPLKDPLSRKSESPDPGVSELATADAVPTLDAAGPTGAKVFKSIGPYQLVKKLGEGGMGQVWLADQSAPLQRRVALKLIRAGMYDESLLRRFQAERQSLAIMDHPCIAKVFDAGTTSDGQPYFVMEYVPGQPITHYCDQKKLNIRDRLELFIQACDGVQHAHQKAIIHRDLKPANILVVEIDGKPMPRIIDFGLAKALGPSGAGDTFATRIDGFVGTPGFMSPEQADPNVVDVDTRTDVYSLGMILYVLLTGTLPFDTERWRTKPFDAVLKELREEDSPKPSARLATQGAAATTIAENRGTQPRHLLKQLRADLDWITMKAIEKDRTRRYGTPSELAEDIRRYLANEPVVASPVSPAYRLRKYVRRHRVAVAVAATLALLLTAFAGVQAAELRRITRERDRANRITDFMSDMFKVSDPSEARGNTVTAREILDKASQNIDTGMARDPELQAEMMNLMAEVYESLGLYSRSKPLFARAADIRLHHLGPKNPDTLDSQTRLAWDMAQSGQITDAEKSLRNSLDIEHRQLGPGNPETTSTTYYLGWTLELEGHYQEAETFLRETLDIRRRTLGAEHPDTLVAMNLLAFDIQGEGRYAEAEKLFRETLEVRRRVLGSDHPRTLSTMGNLATTLMYEGKYAEAERLERETLAARRRIIGPEHPQTLAAMNLLALVLRNEGKYTEAESLQRETLDISRRVLGPEHPNTVTDIGNLAATLQLMGRSSEAEKLDRETVAIDRRVLGPDNPDTMGYTYNLAIVLEYRHQYAEAEKMYREVLDSRRRVLGPEHPQTLESMASVASVLLNEGRYAEAEKLTRETVEIQRRVVGPENPDTANSTYQLARAEARLGKLDDALSLMREAVDHGLPPNQDLDIEKDDDLKSLHGDPRFDSLVADAKQRAAAAQKPQ
ncbi:MAG TPA: serine/threonine-protein kinase [Candidatus Acidoferrales bacterium]|nr:serine/threonine-protein kinase [Candidatus Acidoferrales bacterium]